MAELTQDAKEFNSNFLANLETHCGGQLKSASEALSKHIITKRKLREDAIHPAIQPYENFSPADLHEQADSEDPIILCQMEAEQFGALSTGFAEASDTVPYYGNKYVLGFSKNRTQTWTKDINLLHTYRGDIREMTTDLAMRDMARQKDHNAFEYFNDIIGAIPGGVSGLTGRRQSILYPGKLTRDNWVSGLTLLMEDSLPTGCMVMNYKTLTEFMRLDRNQIGGDFSQELFLKGNRAWDDSVTISGVKVIVTMKSDLVPNGVVYQFAPHNYMGRAGTLYPPTMYVEKKEDILSFSCCETLGFAVGNLNSLRKVTFQGIANSTCGDGRIIV